MISYTAEQGQELLNRFSLADQESVDFSLHVDQAVQIVFSVVGLKPPTQEDLDSFNKAIRIFSLDIIDRNTPDQASHYKLTIRAKRQKVDNETFSDLFGNEAVLYCFTQAQHFLAALAMATNTIVFWRDLRAVPIAISSVGSAMPEIQFTDLFKVFSSPITLHAGHLYKAIEIFGHLDKRLWPERFYELYHKGMMFFATPEMPGLSFQEESYQSFYKCFEYLVMARILKKRGQYKSTHLPEAFNLLGIKPADGSEPFAAIKRSADALSAKRGQVISHFVLGNEHVSINPEEVFELKGVVDFMIRAYVTKQL